MKTIGTQGPREPPTEGEGWMKNFSLQTLPNQVQIKNNDFFHKNVRLTFCLVLFDAKSAICSIIIHCSAPSPTGELTALP